MMIGLKISFYEYVFWGGIEIVVCIFPRFPNGCQCVRIV
jgi:hypothetical protein